MATFSRQRGLFGAPMANATAAIDPRASEGAGMVQQAATVPTYKKPSTANLIIGTIGDTLSQWGGGKGTYLPGLQAQQQAAMEAAQYQQRRADDYTDWQRKEQYKAANPGPSDDAFTRAAAAGGIMPGTPEFAALSRQRAQTLAAPAPTFVSDGAGGGRWVQPSLGGVAPQAPVGKLTPLGAGGAAPGGPRTFPVR